MVTPCPDLGDGVGRDDHAIGDGARAREAALEHGLQQHPAVLAAQVARGLRWCPARHERRRCRRVGRQAVGHGQSRQQGACLGGVPAGRVERGNGPCGKIGGQRNACTDGQRLVEQARSCRGGEQRQHVGGACGLPHQRDVGPVAAEAPDVVPDEAQRLEVVQQRVVAAVSPTARVQGRQLEETQHVEPVVGGDHHSVGPARQRRAVVHRVGRVARDAAAAMQEQQHGQVVLGAGRAPDVQGQAIFAADRGAQRLPDGVVKAVVGAGAVQPPHLQAGIAEARGIAIAFPRRGRLRRSPAQRADRRRRIGNVPEFVEEHALHRRRLADQRAAVDLHARRRILRDDRCRRQDKQGGDRAAGSADRKKA